MYMIEDMIDMGFPEDKPVAWTSDAHRQVAQFVCLFNDRVTRRDDLIEMVSKINAIPMDDIKLVTVADLAVKYHVPNINLS